MSDLRNSPVLPKAIIPWWQDGSTIADDVKEPHFLSAGVSAFFGLFKGWLLFPLQQANALTCSELLLTLLAWDRDINQFANEPLSLFRKRVKFAAINAKDAGSVAGFKAIFERLDIGIVAFNERESLHDWDVCTIEMSDSELSQNSALIQTLIEQYGRTCRRYRFQVTYPSMLFVGSTEFAHRFALFTAQSQQSVLLQIKQQPIEHQQQLFIATL